MGEATRDVAKYPIMHRTVPHHKGIPFFFYEEYSHFSVRIRTEGRRRHSTNTSGLCFFIVVRKDNMKSTLDKFFDVLYSIANYKHYVVQQISRMYSSCLTENLYPFKNSNSPFPPFPIP